MVRPHRHRLTTLILLEAAGVCGDGLHGGDGKCKKAISKQERQDDDDLPADFELGVPADLRGILILDELGDDK